MIVQRTAVMAGEPRRIARRRPQIDRGRMSLATDEKSRSIWKSVLHGQGCLGEPSWPPAACLPSRAGGLLSARTAKWVRIEHDDTCLPRQVAWFAPGGHGMFSDAKRVQGWLEAGIGAVPPPQASRRTGGRAGSP